MRMRGARALMAMLLCAAAGLAAAQGAQPDPTDLGPNAGYWAPERYPSPALNDAVANASQQAGHPVVLWVLSKKEPGSVVVLANRFAEKWPDRTLMLVNDNQLTATLVLRPAAAVKDLFTPLTSGRMEVQMQEAMRLDRVELALARLVGEVGAIAAGQTPEPWDPKRHLLQSMMGGQDVAEKDKWGNLALTLLFPLAIIGLLAWWLRLFLGNPKEAILGLLVMWAGGVLSNIGSGGGGSGSSSGGGMSGGGGGFDGGGATGSW
jgi:hypothetical protein